MKNIVFIVAKSATGKDTLFNHLMDKKANNFNFKKVILYYTRPAREGEKNGDTYFFCNVDELEELKKENPVIAMDTYHTNVGDWHIALLDDEQFKEDGNYLCVVSLKFYYAARKYFHNRKDVNIIPIYLWVDNATRMERAMAREEMQEKPNYKEICRRFINDERDFPEELVRNIPYRFKNDNKKELFANVDKELTKIFKHIEEFPNYSIYKLEGCNYGE